MGKIKEKKSLSLFKGLNGKEGGKIASLFGKNVQILEDFEKCVVVVFCS